MKQADIETNNRADANILLLKPPGRTKLTEASIKQTGDFVKVDIEEARKRKDERIAEAKRRRQENKRMRKRIQEIKDEESIIVVE